MADGSYFTFSDIVDHLLYTIGAGADSDASVVKAKNAVQTAYRDLPTLHHWSYYSKRLRLDISASHATGTITYDHTGGASERLFTISTGTLPTWTASGVLTIDSIDYQVDTRESATTGTLKSDSNPGADVAAGTSYILHRDFYTLPVDWQKNNEWRNATNQFGMFYVDPGEWEIIHDSQELTGTPRRYTYLGDRDTENRMAIYIYPSSDSAYAWDTTYQRSPIPMKVMDYQTGTVTVLTTTVTGVGTVWTSDMVGSVFRIGDATNVPDGRDGLFPFAEEVLITAVASNTSLTIASALTGTYTSATKYKISDIVDVEHGSMQSLFEILCEKEFARRQRHDSYKELKQEAVEAQIRAMAADSRNIYGSGQRWEAFDQLTNRVTSDYLS